LPLFLVESAVASSVAVTAGLAVLVLGVRLRRIEVAALAVTFFGLVLLAICARDGAAQHVGPVAGWMLLGSAGGVLLILLAGLRMVDRTAGSIVLAVASGLGFGVLGISARTLQVRTPWWHTVADPVLWAVIAHGVLSAVAYGFALQRGRTTTVAAITFTVETVLPAGIGLAFLGDAVRTHLVPLAAVGFLATVGGSIMLSAHAEPDRVEVPAPPTA
jgi:drug/metabolite transporter (DMT)-like permease